MQEGNYLEEGDFQDGNDLLAAAAAGDLVRVYNASERYLFTGEVVDANTVKIPYKEETVNLTATFKVKKVYDILTSYDKADLHDLKFEQFRDEVIISHIDYQTRVLRRSLVSDEIVFAIRTQRFLNSKVTTGKTGTIVARTDEYASNTGGFQWTVAIVEAGDKEYPVPTHDGVLTADVDIGVNTVDLTWDRYGNAELYRVYGTQFKPNFNALLSPVALPPVDPGDPDPPVEPPAPSASMWVRNAGADYTLASILTGALAGTTFDGTYVRALIVSPSRVIRAYNPATGARVSGADITLSSGASSNRGLLFDGTNYGTVNDSGDVRFHTTTGALVANRNLTLPSGSWQGALSVAGWYWYVDATNNRIARVDPVSLSVDTFIGLPSESYAALVSDGVTIWAVSLGVVARAYNISLEVLTPALDFPAGLPFTAAMRGAYYLPDDDEIHVVHNLGQVSVFDLVEQA